MNNQRKLRVCYFGTYRKNYSRNRIMIEGLLQNGVDVVECHETLWRGIGDRIQITGGGWLNPRFWIRVLQAYLQLLRKYYKIGEYDVMVIGYPGQFDVYIGRLLSRIANKPLVWDIFMSIYLIAIERELDKKNPLTINWLRRVEGFGLSLPNILIQDTCFYAEWLSATYNISLSKFRIVPTGADDRLFRPNETSETKHDDFQILYYGTYIPNHGVDYIIEAAKILSSNSNLQFIMIGDGPTKRKAIRKTSEYHLRNIQFVPWLDTKDLVIQISRADLCLGVFGSTPQSMMTIQNKIFECLAMKKPVISGDSEVIRASLSHDKNIFICERENPIALAEAIYHLYIHPIDRNRIAENGYELFKENYSLKMIGQYFADHIENLVL